MCVAQDRLVNRGDDGDGGKDGTDEARATSAPAKRKRLDSRTSVDAAPTVSLCVCPVLSRSGLAVRVGWPVHLTTTTTTAVADEWEKSCRRPGQCWTSDPVLFEPGHHISGVAPG